MPTRERERGEAGAVVSHETGPRHPDAHEVARTGLALRIEAAVARTPAALAATWRRLRKTAAGGEPEVGELIEAMSAQGGGKQLRARLACAAYLGLGGDDPEACDGLAAAVQLLHSGLCIHDDL